LQMAASGGIYLQLMLRVFGGYENKGIKSCGRGVTMSRGKRGGEGHAIMHGAGGRGREGKKEGGVNRMDKRWCTEEKERAGRKGGLRCELPGSVRGCETKATASGEDPHSVKCYKSSEGGEPQAGGAPNRRGERYAWP